MTRAQASLHLLLWGAGCGVVPSLEVMIDGRLPEAQQLGILVVREDRAAALIDCTVRSGGTLDGRCPFEDPGDRWSPGETLSFVLYGDAGTRLELRAQALDAAGLVVTSTRAELIIPPSGTERAQVTLPAPVPPPPPPPPIPAPRCGLDLAQDTPVPESQRDRTGLVALDLDGDGQLELVVGTPRRISALRWSHDRDTGTCTLTETATVALDCTPRGGTLVAGELDLLHPGPEIAVTCLQRSTNNRLRVAAYALDADGAPVRTTQVNVPFVLNQTTRGVLADLDGDGTEELSMLAVTSTTGPVTSLVTWVVRETRFRTTPISALRLTSPTSNLPLAPLVTSAGRGRREALVVGGYRGGTFVIDADGARTIDANTGTPPSALSGAALERSGSPPRALFVRDATGGTALVETVLEAGARSTARPFADAQRTLGLASVAVAVGDLEGAGTPSAVIAADGYVQIFALGSTTTPARRFPLPEPIDGALIVLLVDVDRVPGAEILAYQPKVGRVFAHTSDGRAVAGFPLDVGVPGPETRMVAADLDRDGALELIAVSYDRVRVVGLEAGTYRADSVPWPEPFRDAAGGASNDGERDPRVP